MRIIEEGKRPADVEYRTTCPHCRCIFEFQAKEAELIHDQREGDYFKISCPTCLSSVTRDKRAG